MALTVKMCVDREGTSFISEIPRDSPISEFADIDLTFACVVRVRDQVQVECVYNSVSSYLQGA